MMLRGNAEVQTVDSCPKSKALKYVSKHGNERGSDEDSDE